MRPYLNGFIILALLYAMLYQCNTMLEKDKLSKANMEALTDSVGYYKNRLGSHTATINTLQLDKQQLEKIVLNKDKELQQLAKGFAAVKSVVKAKAEIRIDTITQKFESPITSNDSAAAFIRTGSIESEWYKIGYKVTNDSLVLSPFTTWTETTVITGIKRKWFLGKQTVVTDITNNNPYVKVTDIKSAEVILPEPWYRKWYVWLAAGVAGGVLLK